MAAVLAPRQTTNTLIVYSHRTICQGSTSLMARLKSIWKAWNNLWRVILVLKDTPLITRKLSYKEFPILVCERISVTPSGLSSWLDCIQEFQYPALGAGNGSSMALLSKWQNFNQVCSLSLTRIMKFTKWFAWNSYEKHELSDECFIYIVCDRILSPSYRKTMNLVMSGLLLLYIMLYVC